MVLLWYMSKKTNMVTCVKTHGNLCFSEVPQSCIVSLSWSTRLLVPVLVGTGWLMFPRGCRCLEFLPLRVQIDPPRANRCSSTRKLPSHAALLLIRNTRMDPGRKYVIMSFQRLKLLFQTHSCNSCIAVISLVYSIVIQISWLCEEKL